MILAGVISFYLTEPYPDLLAHGKSKPQRTSGLLLFYKGLKQLVQTPALRRIALDYALVAWVGYFIIWFYQPRL
jgi:hypothetical protein